MDLRLQCENQHVWVLAGLVSSAQAAGGLTAISPGSACLPTTLAAAVPYLL